MLDGERRRHLGRQRGIRHDHANACRAQHGGPSSPLHRGGLHGLGHTSRTLSFVNLERGGEGVSAARLHSCLDR